MGASTTPDRKKTTVIIKHMFTLDEMFSDPNFGWSSRRTSRRSAEFGAVDKVKVFTTIRRVVSVVQDGGDAQKCVPR